MSDVPLPVPFPLSPSPCPSPPLPVPHPLSLQTSEKQMLIREMGEERAGVKGEDASEQVIYKIDIPANRYTFLHAKFLRLAVDPRKPRKFCALQFCRYTVIIMHASSTCWAQPAELPW